MLGAIFPQLEEVLLTNIFCLFQRIDAKLQLLNEPGMRFFFLCRSGQHLLHNNLVIGKTLVDVGGLHIGSEVSFEALDDF